MNEPENYYRLRTDFFESRAIKKIQKSAGGDNLCYLRMLTLASMNNGRICSEGIDAMIKEIALELNKRIDRTGNTKIIFPQCMVNPDREREWRDNSM